MRYVRQLDDTGCGLACIAMLAGVGYKTVRKIARENNLLKRKTMCDTNGADLSRIGKKFGLSISKKRLKFKGYKDLPKLSILAVDYRDNDINWHWVVRNNKGVIKDPWDEDITLLYPDRPKHYLKVGRIK